VTGYFFLSNFDDKQGRITFKNSVIYFLVFVTIVI